MSEMIRLKYVSSINEEVLEEDTDQGFEFLYVDISSVGQGTLALPAELIRFGSAPSRARRLATAGDTVLSTVRTYLRAVTEVPETEDPLVFSTGFAVVSPQQDLVYPRFLTWQLQGDAFISTVESISTGVSYPATSASAIGDIAVWIPPLDVQRAVAAFLDREAGKIDALIVKQHDLVAALRDRRESAVMDAVTGQERTGPKRDSGVRWIGEVPEHWQVGNIRRYATMHSGHTPSRQVPEYWEDCTVPWFTLADVWQLRDDTRIYLGETAERISELGLHNSSAELLPTGTVALSRTASVGFSGIMPVPMATSQDFWNWVCGPELLPEFLLRVFRAMRREMRSLMAGSTHQTIYKTDAASFVIPVPPLDEQQTIVDHLDEELRRMDRLVDRATALVEVLQERRAALITAAVTGKLDVTTYGKAG